MCRQRAEWKMPSAMQLPSGEFFLRAFAVDIHTHQRDRIRAIFEITEKMDVSGTLGAISYSVQGKDD
jgi:hypothetical protein